jgi:hypothetical protein
MVGRPKICGSPVWHSWNESVMPIRKSCPVSIESVETDGAAFNLREGNNSVNFSITVGLRERFQPMIRFTGELSFASSGRSGEIISCALRSQYINNLKFTPAFCN